MTEQRESSTNPTPPARGVRVGSRAAEAGPERRPAWPWILIGGVFASLTAATVLSVVLLVLREGDELHVQSGTDAALLARTIHARVDERIDRLRDLRGSWQVRLRNWSKSPMTPHTPPSPAGFRAQVAGLVRDRTVFRSVTLVDDEWPEWNFNIAYRGAPATTGNAGDPGSEGPPETLVRRMNDEVLAARATLTEWAWVSGFGDEKLLVVGLPSWRGKSMVAVLDVRSELARDLQAVASKGYDVRLGDHDGVIVAGRGTGQLGFRYAALQSVGVGRHRWPITLWPSDDTVRDRVIRPAVLTACFGLAAALGASAAVWGVFRHRKREMTAARRHLAALQSLNEVAAAISSKLGAHREVLDRLAESARSLLDVRRAAVGLLDETRTTLEMCAFAGDVPRGVPTTYVVADMPASQVCFDSGEVVSVDDLRDPTVRTNRTLVDRYEVVSLILIPLRVEGKNIGLMALTDTKPRRFTDEDLRLAALLGAQAGVILANNRLYLQVRDALEQEKKLLERTERLNAVNAAVYRAATLEDSCRTIADQGPAALGADMFMVDLLEDEGRKMRIVAATGKYRDEVEGLSLPIAGTNAERVLLGGKLLVIEDAAKDTTVHPMLRQKLRIGAQILAPLYFANGTPMGMLVVINHRPTSLPKEQQDLVSVFAARAAAGLENAALNEQTRRDAETKAVLLRELHHRVKNNLAGIVGLLSVNEPEDLSPAAKQWLARVSDRIRTMGRAHELFAQGTEEVTLEALVKQVLPSLSVIRPADAVVRTEMDEASKGVCLRTPQAVSLAMVLHELCSNAFVHGIGEGGALTIRANRLEDAVVLDVIDDGAGIDKASHSAAGRPDAATAVVEQGGGIGLQLVSALVARELHGRFSLRSPVGGGTMARVEFPTRS